MVSLACYDSFMKTLYRVVGLSFLFVFWINWYMRIRFSLGTSQIVWRIIVLLVEFLAAWPAFLMVVLRIRKPWSKFVYQKSGTEAWNRRKEITDSGYFLSERSMKIDPKPPSKYSVKVLVPCYKEALEIVQPTIIAALNMDYDPQKLSVYLCDDGADPLKKAWVEELQISFPNVYYVARPKEFKGHAKAGNMNYTLQHVIYPQCANLSCEEGAETIESNDIVGVLDADMIIKPEFLNVCLEYFERDPKTMAVQTPQDFYNVELNADMFDHQNMGFFQYILPAAASWNSATCVGTNFILSAKALARVGFFPTFSITEDFCLAFKMHEIVKGKFYYHAENLATGEAPEDLRGIFRQRSRWAKGNAELFFKQSVLLNPHVSMMQRLFFFQCEWTNFASAFCNPFYIIVNVAALLFGAFPVGQFGLKPALVFILYYIHLYFLFHFTPRPGQHFLSLWVNSKMGHFMSYMNMKAVKSVMMQVWLGIKTLTFKATDKKLVPSGAVVHEETRDSSYRDIVYHILVCSLILFTASYSIIILSGYELFPRFSDERTLEQQTGLIVCCTLWLFQFLITYSIPIFYALVPVDPKSQRWTLNTLAFLDMLLSVTILGITVYFYRNDLF